MSVRLAAALLRLGTRGAARRFAAAAAEPAEAQAAVLRRILAANAACRYGQAHGFAGLSTVAAFQARVPVVGYDEIAPHVEAIMRGEPAVLTSAPVASESSDFMALYNCKFVTYLLLGVGRKK